ncbi:MAG: PilN domain-containing protein [Nitrosomonadales bacterium]|nr:PilN domain-containing protein [Nitrosomonadales bacterium]
MIRINLLPHRQLKRAERQRQFNLMLVATAVAAGAIVFLGQTVIGAKISYQGERNLRLETANAALDKDIQEIKELKEQIRNVLDRKQVVENLQTDRSQAVVVLDEVSRQMPDGTYLKAIKQQGAIVDLEGIADNNARVATFVRNLSTSEWMEAPNLIEIKSTSINSLRHSNFLLNVRLKPPQQTDESTEVTSRGVNR